MRRMLFGQGPWVFAPQTRRRSGIAVLEGQKGRVRLVGRHTLLQAPRNQPARHLRGAAHDTHPTHKIIFG